jgi:hypothetical protein
MLIDQQVTGLGALEDLSRVNADLTPMLSVRLAP